MKVNRFTIKSNGFPIHRKPKPKPEPRSFHFILWWNQMTSTGMSSAERVIWWAWECELSMNWYELMVCMCTCMMLVWWERKDVGERKLDINIKWCMMLWALLGEWIFDEFHFAEFKIVSKAIHFMVSFSKIMING